ncbi:MAG: conjugal transfer protein TraI [Ginsengibacter sp.]
MWTRKMVAVCILLSWLSVQKVNAQTGIAEVIKAGVKKAIKAVDLKIQRLQNKTIWLQNAQKNLENVLSKLKLDEISSWVEKQKEQYRKYYEELTQVRTVISNYQRIGDIIKKQRLLLDEYNHAWRLIRQDKQFSEQEIQYIGRVYTGILDASIKNIDQISLIIKSFTTKMTDAKRLELINKAADKVDMNYTDLVQFNQQNIILSVQRAKSEVEVSEVKKLYGLP